MRIGFIGYGEAAFCITSGLAENGVSNIVAYDAMQNDAQRGSIIQNNANKTGVKLLETPVDVVNSVDVVFSAVQSSYAKDVCQSVITALRPGLIYADVSASSPTVKLQIWNLLKDTGTLFADAAMMGLLPVKRHKVPITASGNGAQAFCDAVNPLGMDVKFLNDRPGAASAIKLIRSIYMKGYDALIFEMLRAADAFDVYDEIIPNVAASMDNVPFASLVEWMLPGVSVHAARRAAEMKGTLDMLEECGIDSAMTAATKHQLELIDGMKLDHSFGSKWPDSKNWREVIHYVNEHYSK